MILDEARVYNSYFNNSLLRESSIQNCKFKNNIFEASNLSYSDFSNTSLYDIDFPTCNTNGLTLLEKDLKGVILTEYQALEYVKLLGIKIKE